MYEYTTQWIIAQFMQQNSKFGTPVRCYHAVNRKLLLCLGIASATRKQLNMPTHLAITSIISYFYWHVDPLTGSVMVTGGLVDWRCLYVYRDVRTGVVLARSSQPEVGWLGWRNTQDESLLHAVAESCALHRGSSTITSELNHVDSISSVMPSELVSCVLNHVGCVMLYVIVSINFNL